MGTAATNYSTANIAGPAAAGSPAEVRRGPLPPGCLQRITTDPWV
jgi:hypothetical protein